MTGLVNVLIEAMTTDEKSLLARFVQGDGVSPQDVATLEKLRLVDVEGTTGYARLSQIGQAVSGKL